MLRAVNPQILEIEYRNENVKIDALAFWYLIFGLSLHCIKPLYLFKQVLYRCEQFPLRGTPYTTVSA